MLDVGTNQCNRLQTEKGSTEPGRSEASRDRSPPRIKPISALPSTLKTPTVDGRLMRMNLKMQCA